MFPHSSNFLCIVEFLGRLDRTSANLGLFGGEVRKCKVETWYALDDTFEARISNVFNEGEISFEVSSSHAYPIILLNCFWFAVN